MTFRRFARANPHLVVRDNRGTMWTRGPMRDDALVANTFRWEYCLADSRQERPNAGDWVWLPLVEPAPPLPFMVVDTRHLSREAASEREGRPRGEGMERAAGRATAFSLTCGAAMLEYVPYHDVSDRSDVAARALRSVRSGGLARAHDDEDGGDGATRRRSRGSRAPRRGRAREW